MYFRLPPGQDCAVQLSGQTAARYSLEICHFQGIVHAAFFACLQNGAGQRMLALFLQGVGQLQKLRLIDALAGRMSVVLGSPLVMVPVLSRATI